MKTIDEAVQLNLTADYQKDDCFIKSDGCTNVAVWQADYRQCSIRCCDNPECIAGAKLSAMILQSSLDNNKKLIRTLKLQKIGNL